MESDWWWVSESDEIDLDESGLSEFSKEDIEKMLEEADKLEVWIEWIEWRIGSSFRFEWSESRVIRAWESNQHKSETPIEIFFRSFQVSCVLVSLK